MKTPLPVTIYRGPRSRFVWFVVGFFSALTLAGYVAGLLPAL